MTTAVVDLLHANLDTLRQLGIVEHYVFAPDAVHILMRDPLQCSACATAHHWFINRDGRSRCCHCDEKYQARPKGGAA